MSSKYFPNPFEDYKGQALVCPTEKIKELIKFYVDNILSNTLNSSDDQRGDLYVGNAGIAYMFLRLWKSNHFNQDKSMLNYAATYIQNAKKYAKHYSKRRDERCAFLCGNAGIYAVSAVISNELNSPDTLANDISQFECGFDDCKKLNSDNGNDEVLVGRAGYLSGVYWLNKQINPPPFQDAQILDVCQVIVASGRSYSQAKRSLISLMYQYHGTEYLGAAHGVCSILHMLLESPWFKHGNIDKNDYEDIKNSVDQFLSLQENDGNFPVCLESRKDRREKRLVHWCHGAPGAVYLLAKAFLVFKDNDYLTACKRAADLVWEKGLLYKGPGICHGVAGNGYVFLILFKLTMDEKYLYRAYKFMDFLTDDRFRKMARTPDRPFSLYEGIAGTVCYLVDLLEPSNAAFPFMDIYD